MLHICACWGKHEEFLGEKRKYIGISFFGHISPIFFFFSWDTRVTSCVFCRGELWKKKKDGICFFFGARHVICRWWYGCRKKWFKLLPPPACRHHNHYELIHCWYVFTILFFIFWCAVLVVIALVRFFHFLGKKQKENVSFFWSNTTSNIDVQHRWLWCRRCSVFISGKNVVVGDFL